MSTEHAHQVGRFLAGRIASKREELGHLRERVAQARLSQDRWPCHNNEYQLAKAQLELDEFLEANPQLKDATT